MPNSPARRRSGRIFSLLSLSYSTLAFGQAALDGWTTAGVPNVLTIAAVESDSIITTFSLRNVAGKTVRAFASSFCARPGAPVEHFDFYGSVGAGIAPAALYSLRTANQNLDRCRERTLDVLAVVFGDGTSLGSPLEIRFIKFKRLGNMLEVERIRNILENLGELKEREPGLDTLRERIGTLPETGEAAFDSVKDVLLPGVNVSQLRTNDADALRAFSSGVRFTREGALNDIKRLMEIPAGPGYSRVHSRPAALERMRESYRKLSAAHRAFCEQAPASVLR